MARLLSIGRSRWANWVCADNLPQEGVMIELCDLAGVTMDWLYRGKPEQSKLGYLIRLTARCKGGGATATVLIGETV